MRLSDIFHQQSMKCCIMKKMRSAMVADPEGNLIEIASDFWE